jgi:hypothetical protein
MPRRPRLPTIRRSAVAAGVHERLNRAPRIEFCLHRSCRVEFLAAGRHQASDIGSVRVGQDERHRFGIRRICRPVNAYDDALWEALEIGRSATDQDGAGAFTGHARPVARFQPGAPSVMDVSDAQREQARPVAAEAEREL